MQALGVPGLGRDLLEGMAFPSSPAFEAWLLAERRRFAGRPRTRFARPREPSSRLAMRPGRSSSQVASSPPARSTRTPRSCSFAPTRRAATGPRRNANGTRVWRCSGASSERIPARRSFDAADPKPRRSPPERPPTTATRGGWPGNRTRRDGRRRGRRRGRLATAGGRAGVPRPTSQTCRRERCSRSARRSSTAFGGGTARAPASSSRPSRSPNAPEIRRRRAQAHRELGYVELLRGRYDRAQRWLRDAVSLAGDDPAERAWAHAVQGVALTDVGRHADALHELSEAVAPGRRDQRRPGRGLGADAFIGRSHLLRRDLVRARKALEACSGPRAPAALDGLHPASRIAARRCRPGRGTHRRRRGGVRPCLCSVAPARRPMLGGDRRPRASGSSPTGAETPKSALRWVTEARDAVRPAAGRVAVGRGLLPRRAVRARHRTPPACSGALDRRPRGAGDTNRDARTRRPRLPAPQPSRRSGSGRGRPRPRRRGRQPRGPQRRPRPRPPCAHA